MYPVFFQTDVNFAYVVRYLDLSRNPLITVERDDLAPNIKYLKLVKTTLTEVPSMRAAALEELDISGNHFKEFKMSGIVSQLASKLTVLRVTSAHLSEIPPEIGYLTSLTELDISKNNLKDFPADILQLKTLKKLNIGRNKLTKIPPQISLLANLEELDLQSNDIENLPASLGNIEPLRSLNLHSNQLDSLPPSLGRLKLAYLNFEGNKLRHIPKSIVAGGVTSVMGHLKDLVKGFEPCYRMRLIVVGPENVRLCAEQCIVLEIQSFYCTNCTNFIVGRKNNFE
jgi:Leucine-rich repeat (LRR) protein